MQNSYIVIAKKIHIKEITHRASSISLNPKNIELHIKFKNNCIIKNDIATNFLVMLFVVTKTKKEAKIIRYKIIQTGAKIQSGGAPDGRFSEWYQSKLSITVLFYALNLLKILANSAKFIQSLYLKMHTCNL